MIFTSLRHSHLTPSPYRLLISACSVRIGIVKIKLLAYRVALIGFEIYAEGLWAFILSTTLSYGKC